MGSNFEGQLGETAENKYEDRFVKIKLLEPSLRISSIECGALFSAYIAGNKLFMSGSNQYGQLGLGYKTKFMGFTEVMTIYEDFKISCGRNHSIVHLVKSNQVLVSGFNGEAQLGIGTGPNVRTFKLIDMKFDKKIAHILCGRASSVSSLSFISSNISNRLLLLSQDLEKWFSNKNSSKFKTIIVNSLISLFVHIINMYFHNPIRTL